MPQRLQRRRARGWRMPKGAVYVGRPTQWGNPFVLREVGALAPNPEPMWAVTFKDAVLVRWDTRTLAAADAVDRFRRLLREHPGASDWIRGLRGRDLACWCPLDQPCHADVLLEIANG
jgi:hypothetical protein